MILILLLAAMAVSEDTSVRAMCLPVEGDRIVIGDIPGFSGTESIGFAPAPGAQRRFSVGELRRIAERKGIDAATIEPVCFERPLFALTEERVRAALRESLPQDAALEVIEFSNSKVPKGALEFPRAGLAHAIWKGRVKYGAAQSVPVWAKVRVWISRPVAVAM